MRIAHVSDCYLPRTGGIETQVRALALHQRDAGDSVRIITATAGMTASAVGNDIDSLPTSDRGAGTSLGEERVDGIPVHRLSMSIPFDLPIHLRTRREVSRVLSAHPVDVLHVHAGVISPFAWGAVRAAREHRIPVLVTVHSIWGEVARPSFWLSDRVLGWTRWGVQLSAVSEVAAKQIRAALPRSGEVLVIPNGIEPADWQVEPVPGISGVLRVVTVMRLAPRKRLFALLRIIRRAQRLLGPDGVIQATIVGDGPERTRAEAYARLRVAGGVQFTGRLDRPGILEQFAHADVYMQPSVKESFGIAALEARCAGLPVIARSEAGTAHFIRDGVEGLLADSDEQMAAALVQLARDRARLATLREHNASTWPEESWTQVLQAASLGYSAAIARTGSPSGSSA